MPSWPWAIPSLKLSPVGENPGQITAGHHGRKSGEAKAFPAPIASSHCSDFQEKILGPSIVARVEAGRAKVEISRHLERNIPERLGNSLGALAEPERFRRMTDNPEVVAHVDGQLAESPLIVERPRQALGFAETAEDPLEFSERKECGSQVEAKIDGLLQPLAGLGQMPQGRQRLLEARDRLPVGRSRQCLGAGLTQVRDRLLPHLTARYGAEARFDAADRLDQLRDVADGCSPPRYATA